MGRVPVGSEPERPAATKEQQEWEEQRTCETCYPRGPNRPPIDSKVYELDAPRRSSLAADHGCRRGPPFGAPRPPPCPESAVPGVATAASLDGASDSSSFFACEHDSASRAATRKE